MNGRSDNTHVGVIAVGTPDLKQRIGKMDYVVEVVKTERELISRFIDKVRDDWDPEALAGYEVHHSSWGYLLERGASDALKSELSTPPAPG
jgi:DNA polymerase zeta